MKEPKGVEVYLGDGLYGRYDDNCFHLRAPRENGDHFVVLELRTLNNFIQHVERSLGVRFAVTKIEKETKDATASNQPDD